MSPLEVVAVFAGVPVLVIAVVATLVYGSSARRTVRYRPGQPFTFAPVWFLAAGGPTGVRPAHRELEAGASAAASTHKGGVSGSW